MNKKSNKCYRVIIMSLLGCILFGQYSYAETIGLVGLFTSKNEQAQSKMIAQLDQQNKKKNCVVRREGKIMGSQGNYKLPPFNGFFVLECEKSLLSKADGQLLIENLDHFASHLVLLEGPTNQFGDFGLSTSGVGKDYIFKISNYNNLKPYQREHDLLELSSEAQKRQPHYNTEAFIRIADAYGMQRPDEIVAIYYDSPKEALKFRNENKDILENIGKFNTNHLSQFSYLSAISNR